MAGKLGAPLGNRNSAKGKIFAEAVRRALARRHEGAANPLREGLDELADFLIKTALAGEAWAFQELTNRLEGKPAQAVQVSGDEDAPLLHRIERVIVRATPIHTDG